MMRIITGTAKGIKLKTLEGTETRPTSERVKEAVFSMIQFEIADRQILDLFAGSGQMGLEALSRGAAHATMIDRSKDAVRIIRENAEKTHLSCCCDIFQYDYMDFIRRYRGTQFDLVFLDPPYALGLYQPALTAMIEYEILKPSSMVICESADADLLANNSFLQDYFEVQKQSHYSKSYITILGVKRGA